METFSRETIQQYSLDPWYVTGLVDGEGSFTFSRSGKHMGLYFAIRLNDQDKELLASIQKYFGDIGFLYPVKAFISNSGKTKAACYYRVTRIVDLLKIVKHFDDYPLKGLKKQSFQVWKDMVLIKRDNYKKKHTDKLEALAQKLSAISPRNQIWYNQS